MTSSDWAAAPLATRRQFIIGATSVATAALWPAELWAATAPHSFTHGAFEITVVSDGTVLPPPMMLQSDAPPAELEAAFAAAGLSLAKPEFPANASLIRSGDELILVDTGSGPGLGPTAGKLLENLTAAGIDPASITKVVFSHAHPDHIWGTLGAANALNFPNAAYYVGAAEWDFWMTPGLEQQFPQDFQMFVTEGVRQLNGVKDRLTMLKPGDEVIPGVRAFDTFGHTPGHLSLELEGGDGLIIVADALIFSTVSVEHPDWQFAMDTVQEQAAATRKTLLDRAATDKSTLIGFHWPYPGVGRIERSNGGYRFVAAG